MNKAINSVKPHEKEALLNRWLTIIKEKKLDTELLVKIVLYIVAVSLFIILFIIYRANKKLRVMNKKLEKISQTDKLTSIYNRTKLDMILELEFKNKKRYEKPLSLILIDIDYFKKINDTCGHLCGDEILKEFSNLLKNSIRETDFIGRWGGEEFLIILQDTDINGAIKLAEKLRKLIFEYTFPFVGHKTASFGVSTYHAGDDEKNIIKRADNALYEAKKAGRNLVFSEKYF